MKVKESEKFVLKFNIQKTNIMAFGPITSCQIGEGGMETCDLLQYTSLENSMDRGTW